MIIHFCNLCHLASNVVLFLLIFTINVIKIFELTVPPNIVDEGTSGDIVATEGEDVSLSCKADGRPLPRILWRREDGTNIQLRNEAGELHKGKKRHIYIYSDSLRFGTVKILKK